MACTSKQSGDVHDMLREFSDGYFRPTNLAVIFLFPFDLLSDSIPMLLLLDIGADLVTIYHCILIEKPVNQFTTSGLAHEWFQSD